MATTRDKIIIVWFIVILVLICVLIGWAIGRTDAVLVRDTQINTDNLTEVYSGDRVQIYDDKTGKQYVCINGSSVYAMVVPDGKGE